MSLYPFLCAVRGIGKIVVGVDEILVAVLFFIQFFTLNRNLPLIFNLYANFMITNN